MPLEPGRQLLHYRILAKLGEGGMGEVYRAEDTRLGREIAIKVLPSKLAGNEERRRRFEQEARAVAALKHPNIVTLYSVDQAEGVHFITMELIEGRPLSELIPRRGLDLQRFFELTIPAADALSSAHAKGITHRDLKPANLMVDHDGRVKVLDFGLAKLFSRDESSDETATQILVSAPHTEEGKILGTTAYMSPEQAEGKPVDERTDIFSFGVILFEMATGARPFQGDTAISTVSAILKDVPPRVTELKPGLPRHLGRIIDHCLEKNPDKRFQTARDVVNELENLRKELDSGQLESGEQSFVRTPEPATAPRRSTWLPVAALLLIAAVAGAWWVLRDRDSPTPTVATAPSGASREMIAVLPFENLGPAEDAYFAAGIADEIIGRLSAVGGLGVISRTSVTQYDRTGKTLRQVGDDLGVSYVLEGTVRWARTVDGADRVRITPQLVRVADDSQLWAETYDRKIDDIFAVQSDIAGEVIDRLGVTLTGGERAAMEQRPTDNMEAYQAYLKGKKRIAGATLEEWERSTTENLERATQLDPEFLEAWSALSQHHSSVYHGNFDRTQARLDRAKEAMQRAVAIDATHPAALLARGYYRYYGFREYDRALEDFEAALAIVPNDAEARESIAYIHRRQGKLDDALAELQAVRRLAPRSATLLGNLAQTYRALRDFDRSIELRRQLIELEPDNGWTYLDLAFDTARQTGEISRGLAEWRRSPVDSGSQAHMLGSMWLARWNGDFGGALEFARQVPGESPLVRVMRAWWTAWCLSERDGVEAARASLEAVAGQLRAMLEAEPGNATLRGLLSGAYARLGDGDAAVREARLAVDLTAKDRFVGPQSEQNLASVYAELGRADDAAELIEKLLGMAYSDSLTLTDLRLDPAWDKIREHPRIRELIAE